MNNLSSLFGMSLLLVSAFALAEEDRGYDLRYCLDLPTVEEIAKCSGEISPGDKGRTYSREEVERILSREQAVAPVTMGAASEASAITTTPVVNQPIDDALPEQSESTGN